jgi:excisionase family DNA binding protein
MAPTEELVHDLVDLNVAHRSSRGKPRQRVGHVEGRMRKRVGPGVSKTVASRVLGVSVNTVDKWIARGSIRTVRAKGERRLVELTGLIDLATAMQDLREAGHTTGVLAAAILHLQQHDPHYRRDFEELYGESLTAAKSGDLIPATIPDTFGPED